MLADGSQRDQEATTLSCHLGYLTDPRGSFQTEGAEEAVPTEA